MKSHVIQMTNYEFHIATSIGNIISNNVSIDDSGVCFRFESSWLTEKTRKSRKLLKINIEG
ncbi:protein of unknown function [Candidatus Nitrosocosmicus franklandus]|uniref:Uncharacterized protein n=1 Tax=Candidatus Nitrosocosmicus franklandianus TaxID=1798806 RepID=A0A484I8X1_9ARCH|nr:protein of unknown function [Candidatus Nitrosocosmicus franklandus]